MSDAALAQGATLDSLLGLSGYTSSSTSKSFDFSFTLGQRETRPERERQGAGGETGGKKERKALTLVSPWAAEKATGPGPEREENGKDEKGKERDTPYCSLTIATSDGTFFAPIADAGAPETDEVDDDGGTGALPPPAVETLSAGALGMTRSDAAETQLSSV